MSGPQVGAAPAAVADGRRLYAGDDDGVYDSGVRDAVATFQRWRAVTGDPVGVYGANSRRQLESETASH
jgi:peptidoglycan hydrolase-like protein with peptidoglycan-binding domain